MKKLILFAFLAIFSICTFAMNPDSKTKSDNLPVIDKKENQMSDKEISNLTKPAEELNNTDKTTQTVIVSDGHRHRRGHEGMNGNHRRNGGVIFIGGGGVLLIIILVLLLA